MSWSVAKDALGRPYVHLPSSLVRIMLNVGDAPTAASALNDGFTASALRDHMDALVACGFLRRATKGFRATYVWTPAGREFAESLDRLNTAFRKVRHAEDPQ